MTGPTSQVKAFVSGVRSGCRLARIFSVAGTAVGTWSSTTFVLWSGTGALWSNLVVALSAVGAYGSTLSAARASVSREPSSLRPLADPSPASAASSALGACEIALSNGVRSSMNACSVVAAGANISARSLRALSSAVTPASVAGSSRAAAPGLERML